MYYLIVTYFSLKFSLYTLSNFALQTDILLNLIFVLFLLSLLFTLQHKRYATLRPYQRFH
jgi:hypothetical protein